MSPSEMLDEIWDDEHLNQLEREFISRMSYKKTFTKKQSVIIERLYAKVITAITKEEI